MSSPGRRLCEMRALATFLLGLCCVHAGAAETWYLVDFKPGPNWIEGRGFDGQKGAQAHRDHVAEQFARGQALMSGTLEERTRVVVFKGPLRVVQEAVVEDPIVRSGVVQVTIAPFDIDRSRVRITPAVITPDGNDDREPFTLGGSNKEAPIRIEDE